MSSRWTAAFAALAMLALSPSLAAATDTNVEQQLQQMQQRMQQMEDKLQATTDQLDSANQRVDEQSRLIEQSGLAETRGSSNGLPGFLGQITVGGWVSSSYFYNLNGPKDHNNPADTLDPVPGNGGMEGTNAGDNGKFYPLHPDANSFALDQVWWEIERPINEENRAGFRLDTVMGKTGALLNGGGPSNRRSGIRDDTSIYIDQGYVQYLAPVGDGVTFKAGKFATPVGYEVAGTIYNQNITRGNVWNLLEPIEHIGITAAYTFGDSGFDAMVGGANGFAPDSPDRNSAKTILGHVGWASDKLSVAVNGLYGGEQQGNDGKESMLVNLLIKANPIDRLALYVNGDYAQADLNKSPYAWGVAAGGRYGITDRTGFSLRGEYVADDAHFLGFGGWANNTAPGFPTFQTFLPTSVKIWGVTGTLDHLLTDQLMVRAEVRWDMINKNSNVSDGEFFHDSVNSSSANFGLASQQVTLGAEVVYNFNKFGGQ